MAKGAKQVCLDHACRVQLVLACPGSAIVFEPGTAGRIQRPLVPLPLRRSRDIPAVVLGIGVPTAPAVMFDTIGERLLGSVDRSVIATAVPDKARTRR